MYLCIYTYSYIYITYVAIILLRCIRVPGASSRVGRRQSGEGTKHASAQQGFAWNGSWSPRGVEVSLEEPRPAQTQELEPGVEGKPGSNRQCLGGQERASEGGPGSQGAEQRLSKKNARGGRAWTSGPARERLFRILTGTPLYFCFFLIFPSWSCWSRPWRHEEWFLTFQLLQTFSFSSKKKSKHLNTSKSKGKNMQLRIFLFNIEEFFKIHRSLSQPICCFKFHSTGRIHLFIYFPW